MIKFRNGSGIGYPAAHNDQGSMNRREICFPGKKVSGGGRGGQAMIT